MTLLKMLRNKSGQFTKLSHEIEDTFAWERYGVGVKQTQIQIYQDVLQILATQLRVRNWIIFILFVGVIALLIGGV